MTEDVLASALEIQRRLSHVGAMDRQPNFGKLRRRRASRSPSARDLGDAARLRPRADTGQWSSATCGWRGALAAPRRRGDPELERVADVPLNVVCFRDRPAGVAEGELDDLNRRLGQAVLHDGRVYVGTTVYDGKVAFRPAIVNWRTEEADVDLIVPTTRELENVSARSSGQAVRRRSCPPRAGCRRGGIDRRCLSMQALPRP